MVTEMCEEKKKKKSSIARGGREEGRRRPRREEKGRRRELGGGSGREMKLHVELVLVGGNGKLVILVLPVIGNGNLEPMTVFQAYVSSSG